MRTEDKTLLAVTNKGGRQNLIDSQSLIKVENKNLLTVKNTIRMEDKD